MTLQLLKTDTTSLGKSIKTSWRNSLEKLNRGGEGISGRKNMFKAVQSMHKGPVVRRNRACKRN